MRYSIPLALLIVASCSDGTFHPTSPDETVPASGITLALKPVTAVHVGVSAACSPDPVASLDVTWENLPGGSSDIRVSIAPTPGASVQVIHDLVGGERRTGEATLEGAVLAGTEYDLAGVVAGRKSGFHEIITSSATGTGFPFTHPGCPLL